MMYRVAAKASISRHAMQTQKRNLSGTCRCVVHAITILTNFFKFEFKKAVSKDERIWNGKLFNVD